MSLLKAEIYRITSIPPEQQRIKFEVKSLTRPCCHQHYVARVISYLFWQESVLYEDGATLSKVGIKDGSSVHLAIYSTNQVCMIRS